MKRIPLLAAILFMWGFELSAGDLPCFPGAEGLIGE